MKKAVFATAALTLFAGNASGAIPQHLAITQYDGPQTCIACHQVQAQDMVNSLHMQWKGATPELTNAPGKVLGKAVGGINTFCTYAPSSKGACYACHVRADGNAPHPPTVNDVDCLMCHSDTYQRKTVADPTKPVTVTDIFGKVKTYIFGKQDALGNYTTVPDYTLMPAGTTMVSLAQNVHKPTRTSCLRCHAKAGGGDWTKRGDMGLSTKNPTVAEDVHMSPAVGGKNMTCTSCHVTTKHKIGGRGIDLRQTEAADPKCTNCHTAAPHSNAVLNRHAQGQVGCQTCHIRTFGKGGATEMSRNWLKPVWDPAFCAGQGGYVGTEVKVANVKPEYRWFDGTSYVYNVGEIITKNADGTYTMARANGKAFNGKSQIVPIKNHWSVMPLHPSGKIIPPVIMDMFMTGDFKKAVLAGIKQQGLTGTTYTMVRTNAEMLISHGVDPKSKAPLCTECHATTGKTVDGTKMLPLGKLGYHTWPAKVANCTLCHSAKTSTWEAMHNKHAASNGGSVKLACASCHTPEPTGLVSAKSVLCKTCHSLESWSNSQELHKEHISKGYQCSKCHTGVTIAVAQTTTPPPATTNALIKPKSDLCNDCHSLKSWSNSTALHTYHAGKGYTCTKCHTGTTTTPPPTPPTTTGNPLVKPTSDLCNDCHSLKSWSNSATLHTFHAGKGYTCTKCHQA